MTDTSYHISNLGSFGESLRRFADLDGFVWLPGSEWTDAHLEGGVHADCEADPDYAAEWWTERTAESQRLTDSAEVALRKWRAR